MDPCTLNMERIVIVVMIFVAISANIEPDFSCDFDGRDNCNITNLEGMWISRNGYFRPNWTNSMPGSMRTFSIPYRFMSPRVNLSFWYSIRGSGNLVVTTCRDQTGTVPEVSNTGSNERDTVHFSYVCASANDVEIQFTATRGSVTPLIIVDDILINEITYSVEATGEPFSTTAVTTFSSPRVYEVYTTSSKNTYTAEPTFGTITTSVISSVITAFVICCLFLVIVLCRRFFRSKKNASGSNPKPTASRNHPALAVDSEIHQNSIQLRDQPTPVSTPMHGGTSDYMGLINPDTQHVYGHATHGNPLVKHYKDTTEGAGRDGDGYEVPFTHQMNSTNLVSPYDDVSTSARAIEG